MLQPLIRLNIGCGNDQRDGYINSDVRKLKGLTLRADAKCCEFREGSVDEVYARDFLEHLTHKQAQEFTANCYRWLRVGGSLKAEGIPNMEIAGRVIGQASNSETLRRIMELIFGSDGDGAGAYIENRHLWGYTPNSLLLLFQDAGFKVEKVVGIMDGLFLDIEGFKVTR